MSNLVLLPVCRLLQSEGGFYGFIPSTWLLTAIKGTTAGIALIIMLIYGRLYFKKKQHLYTTGIRNRLESWISEMISNESEERIRIPPEFIQIVQRPMGRRFVTNELVNCKRNFTGATAKNIVTLYEQLELKKYSLQKLSSSQWHIKARGIQELYLMDQSDTFKRIYKNTNNRHEWVRMEAQMGVLHLTGFDGLRFLDVVSYPITEWQQIKLLEQLRYSKMTERLSTAIPKWLESSNATVVQFALKLAAEFQQFPLHDAVVQCLQHPAGAVRRQAVSTLIRIANEWTPSCLTACFPEETIAGKLVILEGLKKIATEEQASFLTGLLNDENDSIKLKSAMALAVTSGTGLSVLAEKGRQQPHPYEEIYLHVKSETVI